MMHINPHALGLHQNAADFVALSAPSFNERRRRRLDASAIDP